jgi:hypothetical protein
MTQDGSSNKVVPLGKVSTIESGHTSTLAANLAAAQESLCTAHAGLAAATESIGALVSSQGCQCCYHRNVSVPEENNYVYTFLYETDYSGGLDLFTYLALSNKESRQFELKWLKDNNFPTDTAMEGASFWVKHLGRIAVLILLGCVAPIIMTIDAYDAWYGAQQARTEQNSFVMTLIGSAFLFFAHNTLYRDYQYIWVLYS